jgi:hypothetical protein
VLARIQYARSKSSRTRECDRCGTRFAMLHINDHHRCAGCTPTDDLPTVTCLLCHTDAPGLDDRVPLCLSCAKDKSKRNELLAKLVEGQDRRSAKYADPAVRDAAVLALWHSVTPTSDAAPFEPEPAGERTWTIAKREYTLAELHDLAANVSKSQATREQAKAILAAL